MSRSRLVRRGIAAVALLVPFAGSTAHACAACGCGDPSVSQIGIPDTDAGGVVAGLAAEARRDRIGGETQTDSRAVAVGIWTATPELQVYFHAPLVQRSVASGRASGAGDLDAGATLVLARARGISAGQSLMLQAQITLPSGSHENRNVDLDVGSGATSAQLGLAWFAHRKAWRAYASGAWRRAIAPASDFTAGDARLLNVGVQHALTARRLDGTLEINGKREDRSHWPLGTPINDTGGTVAYLTPGLLASIGKDVSARWFVRASVQIPLYSDTFGRQDLGPVMQAGFFRNF